MISTLEKIIGKGKAIIVAGILGAGIAFTNTNTNADVLLYPTVETQEGKQTRELEVGKTYLLKIIADNSGEPNNQTVALEWDLDTKFNIPYEAIIQPRPYYTNTLELDFFEGFKMSQVNYVSVIDSLRSTFGRSGFSRKGPTNRVGVAGVYLIRPEVNHCGQQDIYVKNAISYSPRDEFGEEFWQPLKLKSLSLAVVSKEIGQPVVVINKNSGEQNNIFVGTAGKQVVLQSSTNFLDWSSLHTNSIAGEEFEYTDQQIIGANYQFYRAKTLE